MEHNRNKKYIYNECEVVLTGRTAKRDRTTAPSRRTVVGPPNIIHEITPANTGDGDWKKWVKITELYEIEV